MARLKVGVLISGRGSNMRALIDACADPAFPAEIAIVIANNADAGGLATAKGHGIATSVVDHRQKTRPVFEDELHAALISAGVEFICLAGFMRLLTSGFVNRWHDRLINIHPSLLPAFKGIHVHEQVIAAGARFTGCTVHYVRPDMDAGPIIVQAAVPVAPGDTADDLAARVLVAEHRIYPIALKWIAEGRAHVVGDIVEIDGARAPSEFAVSPAV